MEFVRLVLLAAAAALCCAGAVETGRTGGKQAQVGASFVFGDSLVDVGNNNYLRSLSRADLPPNGIDFAPSGGWPTGRFTNGRTVADIIGELLGQENYAQPFLSPEAKGPVILNGVNYASGAGGILNATGKLFVHRLGMDIQIDYFNITRQELDVLLGKAKAREHLWKRSIFSITIGSNDIINNYLQPLLYIGERIAETPEGFVNGLITTLRSQLIRLYKLDAKKVVVSNIGPVGCIPLQKTINHVEENECVRFPNQLAAQYNAQLRDLLADLNEKLPGAKFLLANVYDLVMELITNYQYYGFQSASDACCGDGGQYRGLIPCGPTSTVCEDRSAYVFWDPFHPSEAANLFMAKRMVDGYTNYISPINLRQLARL